MVKRPRGSAVLVSPCWRPGIWPLFEDQSCNFLCLPLFSVASERLGQMNKTKAIFKMILLYAHPFMPYFFLSSNEHMSSFPRSIPPALSVILLYSFRVSLRSFPSFLPFLTSLLLLPTAFPHSLCLTLICVNAFFLPTAHPLPHKWEQGEQRGEHDAGPKEQGLMKPA